MRRLLPLITTLASGEIGFAISNAKREAIFLAVIAFFGIVAISFGLVAADVALSSVFGPLYGALIIAGVALLICLLAFIIMKISMARARRKARMRREATAAYATAAMAFLPDLLRSRSALAIGIPLAALAGFLLAPGRSRDDGDR